MSDLIFVTGSNSKLKELERVLGRQIFQKDLDLPEIQSINVEQVVGEKALSAFEAVGHIPVIVEDTGLFINCWNGLPGALIRWFLETVGPHGICAMLDSFPDRSAYARTAVAKYDGSLKIYSGEVRGQIASSPRGNKGFGWDTIFIPEGETRTFAEMEPLEKDKFSMRRIAIEKLVSSED